MVNSYYTGWNRKQFSSLQKGLTQHKCVGIQASKCDFRRLVSDEHVKNYLERNTEAPILWPPDVKSWLIGKDPDARKDWRQEEKRVTEDEMVGWHHQLNEHEFEQALGDSEGQRNLVCCGLRHDKESDTIYWVIVDWTTMSMRVSVFWNAKHFFYQQRSWLSTVTLNVTRWASVHGLTSWCMFSEYTSSRKLQLRFTWGMSN